MTTAQIDYLDGEFTVGEDEPSTIAELTAIIGEAGVIDETVSNLRYRNKYPRVYKAVSAAVAALGFAKPVKEEKKNKDGSIKKIHVSDMDHIRAARVGIKDAEGNLIVPPLTDADAVIQSLFTAHGNSEPLYVKGERAGGGGKISTAAMDGANAFFAAGDDKVEDIAAKIETLVPNYKVGRDADGAVTPESLARGIQALNSHLTKQAKAAAMAALK